MVGLLERLDEARGWYLEAVDALGHDGWGRPSLCDGWTAANVVAHVAGGDMYFRALILDAIGSDRSLLASMPTESGHRATWAQQMATLAPMELRKTARHAAEAMADAARSAAAQTPAPIIRTSFGEMPLENAGNIRVLEYVIHGHDLEPASGRSREVPTWYVEHALPRAAQMMARTHQRSPHKGKAASFHLHRTDGDGEWILRAEGGEARSDGGHQPADVAFRGPGLGLYWLLMGRGGAQEHGVEVHGDPELAAAFKEWFPGP